VPPPAPWSDITALYVARFGVPKAGTAIWIRSCQHIDGWTDVPEQLRARVLAPAAWRGVSELRRHWTRLPAKAAEDTAPYTVPLARLLPQAPLGAPCV
jgi:hypothetical protein